MSDLERLNSIIRRTEAAYGLNHPPEQPWECPTCGIIPPYKLPSGRLIRRMCECEKEVRRLQVMRSQRQAWMEGQVFDTYGWLGEQFTDLPLQDMTFESFDESRQLRAYNAARQFVLEPTGNFILHGTYGTGKTHLLAAICNELRQAEIASRFCLAPKLFQAMGQAIGHHEDTYLLMRKAIMTPLLVIDDIDAANPSDWRNEQLYLIFNERAIHNRPTAVSTNKLIQLEKYIGGKARSRLKIGEIAVEMSGTDFRIEM
jgi:DNA replication protein DnaC